MMLALYAAAVAVASAAPAVKDPVTDAQRLPLSWMTVAVLGVQAGTAVGFRDNDGWHQPEHDWMDGFREAPEWDDDPEFYNFVLHPWVGSEYFLIARNRGGTFAQSLLYSALLSAAWEYGAENFLTQPSATDLIATPLLGSVVGELRYRGRRRLAASDRFGRWAGLLDPVDVTVGGFPDGRPHFLLNFRTHF
jgi:hypothetical protein